ncbi:hypothetical protein Zmor_010348 [Zophobas morio]|uniref:Uncharacterized protein n=1 Tax=Zophobas morio TaxID=2755281 RepID=A0AA38ISL2_9CUCU|nr:hypothetical protein Zmor_010348 [Zophobas morio]
MNPACNAWLADPPCHFRLITQLETAKNNGRPRTWLVVSEQDATISQWWVFRLECPSDQVAVVSFWGFVAPHNQAVETVCISSDGILLAIGASKTWSPADEGLRHRSSVGFRQETQ